MNKNILTVVANFSSSLEREAIEIESFVSIDHQCCHDEVIVTDIKFQCPQEYCCIIFNCINYFGSNFRS